MQVKIYTDGAARGAILEYVDTKGTLHTKELSRGYVRTTNNRMELTAVIEAFKALKRDGLTIHVFSDSAYVANCFREKWYESWEKNKWRNAAHKSVENQELWKELLSLVRKHDVTFYRVKGHVKVPVTEDGILPQSAALTALYEKFVTWNGSRFSYEDFLYITKMNNLADELAGKGIDSLKSKKDAG